MTRLPEDRLAQALQKIELPDPVSGFQVTRDVDASGEEALWVWLLIPRDADGYLQAAQDLRPRIRGVAREVTPGYWPYMELTTEAISGASV